MGSRRTQIEVPYMLRALAIAGLCLTSSACIAVGSRDPLFASADGAGAPQPRTGLWASPDEGCNFNPEQPASSWPGCANGTVVRAHVLGPPGDPGSLMDYVIANGDPLILQTPWPRSHAKAPPKYGYTWLQPTRTDEQGRFTEAKLWFVLCGEQAPPPRNMETDRKTAPPDNFKPAEGLDWHQGDDFCMASSKETVRAAAKASVGWTADPSVVKWIRDAEN
jgi:hypothetical protein